MKTEEFTQKIIDLATEAHGSGAIRNFIVIFDTGVRADGTQSVSNLEGVDEQMRFTLHWIGAAIGQEPTEAKVFEGGKEVKEDE